MLICTHTHVCSRLKMAKQNKATVPWGAPEKNAAWPCQRAHKHATQKNESPPPPRNPQEVRVGSGRHANCGNLKRAHAAPAKGTGRSRENDKAVNVQMVKSSNGEGASQMDQQNGQQNGQGKRPSGEAENKKSKPKKAAKSLRPYLKRLANFLEYHEMGNFSVVGQKGGGNNNHKGGAPPYVRFWPGRSPKRSPNARLTFA